MFLNEINFSHLIPNDKKYIIKKTVKENFSNKNISSVFLKKVKKKQSDKNKYKTFSSVLYNFL